MTRQARSSEGMHSRTKRAIAVSAVICTANAAGISRAAADDIVSDPQRPAIKFYRWQEDWSILANPALRTEPFDDLKYIPISPGDPKSYISLGANLRERFEANNAPSFGTKATASDAYLIQRLWIHADIRLNESWQVFTQLEDARAFDKNAITPADQNRLDLRLASVAYTNTLGDNTFKARVGRQDFSFDLQRFVSSRDGPNVRQAFDAIWGDWEMGAWRLIGFVSQPVQYRDISPFDDISNNNFRFSTFRVERKVLGNNELSAYYSRYEMANAKFLDSVGNERRDIFDLRFAGKMKGFDWDLEAMGQTGSVGASAIRAWAVGARTGYTFSHFAWLPRVGIQFDAASGDAHPGDGNLGTFNPLFPNGYYFTLAGYTGYSNLVHLKPSLTVMPTKTLSLMAAVALQWRETTADAIYVQPNIPVTGTAGRGSLWTGVYGQLRADYAFNANLSGALEYVNYQVGDTILRAGGHNSNYLGLELKYGW